MKPWKTILSVMAFSIAATGASAQPWPTKPIRLVVPFPAGTVTDTTMRVIAPSLSASLGQPVIIENRAGADGAIGAQEVARSAPDGYTLLVSTNGFSAVPAMRKNPPYDAIRDFTPISMICRFSFFLLTNTELPVSSVAELMDYGRRNPGKLNYATGNPTGIVAANQMLSVAGVKMVQVPYKGEPAAVIDLVANRVQLMFGTMTTAGAHVSSGKLRILATTLPDRSPAFPDVPTMQEAGITNFAVASFAALQGPAGLPAPIAERLAKELAATLEKPEVRKALTEQNIIPVSSTPATLASYVKDQLELYARILKEAGVEPE